MEETNVITIEFKKEKETKGTIRYKEVVIDTPPIVGTLYVQKWFAKGTTKLQVSIVKED
jgi:hypothetical protein